MVIGICCCGSISTIVPKVELMDNEEQKLIKQQIEILEQLVREVSELARQVKRLADKYAPDSSDQKN
jgi:hypothetical protein